MNSPNAIDRYMKPKPNGEAQLADDSEETDDLGAFGWLRGMRERAVMLELRHKDGTVTALAYAWLERVDFDPSEGLTLKFSGTKVKITGRNLNGERRPNVRMLAGILRHRVPWVQEASGSQLLEAGMEAVVVEQIKIE
ncbi:MAG: hypothetical protein JSS02_25855 [Planctomycetes bacterium]|nr:hypothetical protein [Planctomycetota bacterium]